MQAPVGHAPSCGFTTLIENRAPKRFIKTLQSHPPNNRNGCEQAFSNHTAYVLQGNRVISSNSPSERTYIRGMQVMSTHAEIEALRQAGLTNNLSLMPNIFCIHKSTTNVEYCRIPESIKINLARKRGVDRRTRGYTMLIVRTRWNKDGTYNLLMSKPCLHCALAIATAGIENIVYSDDDGNLIKSNIYNDVFRPSYGMFTITKKTMGY